MEARKLDLTPEKNKKIFISGSTDVLPLKHSESRRLQGGLFLIKALSIFMLLGLFAVLGIFLKGYAGISALQAEVSTIEKMKRQLLSEKADLTAELEGLKASLKIQEEAKYKLGMIYPTAEQIVYLTVEDSTENRNESEKVNIIQEIKQLFNSEP